LVNGVKDGPETQSLNYNGLIGILTKEIKDLKKEMRLLRDSNTKLNEDFLKLSSEMSVLRDIVQELMPL
jgi:predicted nuclease with TOPRIM domain